MNSDNFIDGDGYKDAIISAKEMAKSGAIVALVLSLHIRLKTLDIY